MTVDPCPHRLEATGMGVFFEFRLRKFVRGFRPDRLAFFEAKCRFETVNEDPLVAAGDQVHLDAPVLFDPASLMRESARIEIGA